MYKVVDKIPDNWNVEGKGNPVIVLEDEYGGQSVIGIDDHCLVLYNGSEDRNFIPVSHWYKEAFLALTEFLKNNSSLIDKL